MEKLNQKELNEVKGGGVGKWFFIGAGISFIIGVITGLQRPLSCGSTK